MNTQFHKPKNKIDSEASGNGRTSTFDYDRMEKRCPRLGHQVPFAYCCRLQGQSLCSGIYTCWMSRIPVDSILRLRYGGSFDASILPASRPKIVSILEIINRVKSTDPH